MYSGLVYKMLGIPEELFTPLFAVARQAGWTAHRFEELAYKSLDGNRAYEPLAQRESFASQLKKSGIASFEDAPND